MKEEKKPNFAAPIPVIFYVCPACGNLCLEEAQRDSCCIGEKIDPRCPLEVVKYRCAKCSRTFDTLEDAGKCTHWTDDEELLEGIALDERDARKAEEGRK